MDEGNQIPQNVEHL